MSKHKKSIKVNNKSVIEFNRKYGFRLPIKPYRTGRIKRMRKPIPKHRWPTLTKRIGCQRTFLITIFPNDVFSKALFGITRWNRH